MILYHGTNTFFNEIDLERCSPYKDFGQGFYLTPDQSQAESMAKRRTKLSRCGDEIVLKYEFDENALTDGRLNVLQFNKPTKEWAEFILKNRYKPMAETHDYDVVIGPIADDGVAFQLERYVQEIITMERLVEELTYRRLDTQYFFGTNKAISLLEQVYD